MSPYLKSEMTSLFTIIWNLKLNIFLLQVLQSYTQWYNVPLQVDTDKSDTHFYPLIFPPNKDYELKFVMKVLQHKPSNF